MLAHQYIEFMHKPILFMRALNLIRKYFHLIWVSFSFPKSMTTEMEKGFYFKQYFVVLYISQYPYILKAAKSYHLAVWWCISFVFFPGKLSINTIYFEI